MSERVVFASKPSKLYAFSVEGILFCTSYVNGSRFLIFNSLSGFIFLKIISANSKTEVDWAVDKLKSLFFAFSWVSSVQIPFAKSSPYV